MSTQNRLIQGWCNGTNLAFAKSGAAVLTPETISYNNELIAIRSHVGIAISLDSRKSGFIQTQLAALPKSFGMVGTHARDLVPALIIFNSVSKMSKSHSVPGRRGKLVKSLLFACQPQAIYRGSPMTFKDWISPETFRIIAAHVQLDPRIQYDHCKACASSNVRRNNQNMRANLIRSIKECISGYNPFNSGIVFLLRTARLLEAALSECPQTTQNTFQQKLLERIEVLENEVIKESQKINLTLANY